jgi:hypothetical protein
LSKAIALLLALNVISPFVLEISSFDATLIALTRGCHREKWHATFGAKTHRIQRASEQQASILKATREESPQSATIHTYILFFSLLDVLIPFDPARHGGYAVSASRTRSQIGTNVVSLE